MSTITQNKPTSTTFRIINSPSGFTFQIEVITTAGTSTVRDRFGDVRVFSTRGSARKAITRLKRSL